MAFNLSSWIASTGSSCHSSLWLGEKPGMTGNSFGMVAWCLVNTLLIWRCKSRIPSTYKAAPETDSETKLIKESPMSHQCSSKNLLAGPSSTICSNTPTSGDFADVCRNRPPQTRQLSRAHGVVLGQKQNGDTWRIQSDINPPAVTRRGAIHGG